MQQKSGKLFRRQLGGGRLPKVRKDVSFEHEPVPFARGGLYIGLGKVLRKKFFYRQVAGLGFVLCQRQHARELLFLGNIMRFPVNGLVFCLPIRQAHEDIPRFPAAILAAIDILSVLRHTQPFLCTRIVTANTRHGCLTSSVMHLHNTASYFLCHKIC